MLSVMFSNKSRYGFRIFSSNMKSLDYSERVGYELKLKVRFIIEMISFIFDNSVLSDSYREILYVKSKNHNFNYYEHDTYFGDFFRSYLSKEKLPKGNRSDLLLISYDVSNDNLDILREIFNNLYLIFRRACKSGKEDSILQRINFKRKGEFNFRYIYLDKGKDELHIYLEDLSLENIIKELEFLIFSKINILKLKYCVPSRLEIKIINYLRSNLIKDIDDFIKDSS